MEHKHIIESLKSFSQILTDFMKGIPEDKLHQRRGEDFWTIYEHLHHLAITQLMFFKRLDMFKKQAEPKIVPFIPDGQARQSEAPIKSFQELLSTFAKWRQKQVELIESVDTTIWQKTADHPEYDLYTFEILVRHILLHDGFHIHRMEELWLAKDEYLTKL